MFILELLLDDLAKEAKEAPGWISLWIVCNVALYPVFGITRHFNHIVEDRVTLATCASIVLFFLGDMVDVMCFPRPNKDSERFEKLIRNSMVIFAAVGFFLLFSGYWLGVLAWLSWFVLLPLHLSRTKARKTKEQEREKTGPSGWTLLASKELNAQRDRATKALKLDSGVYIVAKALARRADRYLWKPPWMQNESSKLIRSTVIPMVILGFVLLWLDQSLWGVVAMLSSIALLFLYGRLKSWHMCALYQIAAELNKSKPYETVPVIPDAFRVFFWGKEPVACCEHGHWQEIAQDSSQQPFPVSEVVVK
jgi:hypothetical protein